MTRLCSRRCGDQLWSAAEQREASETPGTGMIMNEAPEGRQSQAEVLPPLRGFRSMLVAYPGLRFARLRLAALHPGLPSVAPSGLKANRGVPAMTEKEWRTCGAPDTLLKAYWPRASVREKRLFGVACCRCALHLFRDTDRCRAAVDAAERFAEGDATPEELSAAVTGLFWNGCITGTCDPDPNRSRWVWEGAVDTLYHAGAKWHAQLDIICNLIRDIFPNPFHPVSLDPAWLTTDVLLLARGIYDERAFDRMPILADALQDGGCGDEEVLNHCRDTNRAHVRGCWVLDLILGKT